MQLPQPGTRYEQPNEAQTRSLLMQADAQNLKRGQDIELGAGRLVVSSPGGTRYALAIAADGSLGALRVSDGVLLRVGTFDSVTALGGLKDETAGLQRVGILGGADARVQLWPTGASGLPWQIDNLAGSLRFFLPGTVYMDLAATRLALGTHILFLTDATYDIGASGANRPRRLYLSSGAGFFGTAAPTSKPAVAGSRGGNAALLSLLTALASYGLITDSTSA